MVIPSDFSRTPPPVRCFPQWLHPLHSFTFPPAKHEGSGFSHLCQHLSGSDFFSDATHCTQSGRPHSRRWPRKGPCPCSQMRALPKRLSCVLTRTRWLCLVLWLGPRIVSLGPASTSHRCGQIADKGAGLGPSGPVPTTRPLGSQTSSVRGPEVPFHNNQQKLLETTSHFKSVLNNSALDAFFCSLIISLRRLYWSFAQP